VINHPEGIIKAKRSCAGKPHSWPRKEYLSTCPTKFSASSTTISFTKSPIAVSWTV
jgi:hypothetical protein